MARDKASSTFRDVGDNADRMGRKVGDSGVSGGGRLGAGLKAGAIIGAAGIGGLGLALNGFVQGAAEAAKIARLTDAVLASTGGAAKISSKQVGDLASAISNKTAVDDDAIQSGANLLLTFTKVRNETGKGNDIFNQATQAAVDMSVALGTDISGASIQLGKALNDPIKGVSALGKAGVSFTEQQKDQIKTMVEAGDTLGAQKIILGEMQTQFGGAAAAAASPLERLKVIAGNLGEAVGGALLPKIERFASFAADTLIPAAGQLIGVLFKGDFKGGPFAEDSPVVAGLFVLREKFLQFKSILVEDVLPRLIAFGGFLRDSALPVLVEVGGAIAAKFLPMLRAIGTFIIDEVVPRLVQMAGYVRANFIPAMQAIGDFIMGRVVPAFQAVAGFVVGTVWPALQTVAGFLVSTFTPTFRALSDFFTGSLLPALQGLVARVRENLPAFLDFAKFVGVVIGVVAALVAKVVGFLLPILLDLAGFLTRTLFAAIGVVLGALGEVIGVFKRVWETAQTLVSLVGDAFKAVGSAASFMWNDVLKPTFKFVVDAFLGVAGAIVDGAAKAFGWVPGLGDKLKDAAKAFEAFRDDVNGKLNGIKDKTVNVTFAVSGQAEVNQVANEKRQARAMGDGPGAGGPMVERISKMIQGTGLSITSTYRTPARNAAVGGSPSSYHLDRSNPAVDVVGPTGALNALYGQLRGAPGLRELLWQVPNHYDHLHVADKGGVFQGPGMVYMGAGQETFASGLAAKKVADLPAGGLGGPVELGPYTIAALVRGFHGGVGAALDDVALGASVGLNN